MTTREELHSISGFDVKMHFARPLLVLLIALGLHAAALGQVERYELGKRLRRFEVAWQAADDPHRQRSVEPMQQAVQSFFGLQLRKAASSLDEAYFKVRSESEPSIEEVVAFSQRLKIAASLIEKGEASSKIVLESFYDAKNLSGEDARIRLAIVNVSGAILLEQEVSVQEARYGTELSLQSLGAGDHQILAEWIGKSGKYEVSRLNLSIVDDLKKRLEAIEQKIQEADESASKKQNDTYRATAKELLQILKQQRAGRVLESDYPSNQLLETCEALVADKEQSAASDTKLTIFRDSARNVDTWITLAMGSKQVATRVRGPKNREGPLPVLFAFHGAGGSENMFFETYGAGRLVQLATDRGWLVVAPRIGLFGMGLDCEKMLDVLSQHFEIDRSRVYLVGHSMGASQVMKQVSEHPNIVSAAVAIGGGGKINRVDSSIPWYVTAGEFDFGKSGAISLAKSLKGANSAVTYREIPHVEHMVVVQAALDEVFAFLDKCPQKKVK